MKAQAQAQLNPEDRPSFLIRDALEALEDAERSTEIKVDMGHYRLIDEGKKICYACLGGSHRLKRLGVIDKPLDKLVSSEQLGVDSIECALDSAQAGTVSMMFLSLQLEPSAGYEFNRPITPYEISPMQFKKQLSELAGDLEAKGW